MKIECDKCAAKYSIADDKVRGKTFKIRCKKCGNVIIVRDKAAGSAAAAEPDGAAATEAGWHLAINGETVGPVSEQEVRDRYATGEIDKDTSIWQEGFDDWVSLGEVSVFSDLPAPKARAAARGDDPFASTAEEDYAAPAAGRSASGMRGLSGGRGAGAHEASPRVSSLTAQRNENSVLFSLDSLQAMATSSRPVTQSRSRPSALATSAPSSEGSGLIDIRQMGAVFGGGAGVGAGAAAGLAASAVNAVEPGDDMLPSFGGGGFGGLASTPLVAQPIAASAGERRSNMGLYVVLAVLVLAVVGLGYHVATQQPVVEKVVVEKDAPSSAAAAVIKEDKEKIAEEEDKKAAAAEESGGENEKEDGGDDDKKGGGVKRSSPRSTGSKSSGGGSSASKSSGSEAPAASPSSGSDKKPTEAPAAPSKDKDYDVDCILNPDLPKCGGKSSKSSGGGSKPAAPAADSNLPVTLSQSDIKSGFEAVKPAAKACGGKHSAAPGTSVNVKVSIDGTTGRVTSSTAQGDQAGTALGNCVAKELMKASFKKFQKAQMGVIYPIRV